MDTTRPKPGQRRLKQVRGETLYMRCFGIGHDGDWLAAHRFGLRGDGVYYPYCKDCRRIYNAKAKGLKPRVDVEPYRKWLEEIVHHCGSIKGAARTMNRSAPQVLGWLGRYNSRNYKRISRDTAKLIVETLVGLRNGTIEPAPKLRNGGKTYVYGCKGCGCRDDLYTPGCVTCSWRRANRSYRKRNAA